MEYLRKLLLPSWWCIKTPNRFPANFKSLLYFFSFECLDQESKEEVEEKEEEEGKYLNQIWIWERRVNIFAFILHYERLYFTFVAKLLSIIIIMTNYSRRYSNYFCFYLMFKMQTEEKERGKWVENFPCRAFELEFTLKPKLLQ